jgi:ketosteroid isomerase-like protein
MRRDEENEMHDAKQSVVASLEFLAADVANVEAVRAVKRLQHGWGQYAEAGDFAAMAQLFARDGRLLLPPAEARGPVAILKLIRDHMADGRASLAPDRLNVVLMLSPVVTVADNGTTARGRWHEVRMSGRHGIDASWSGGIHENDYVLEDGVWKIAVLHYHPQYAGPYRGGWRHVSEVVPLVPYHYTPAEAGTPVPLAPSARADAVSDVTDLSARACALLDESAILNLQAAYGFYVDRKMWDDVADLFVYDGLIATGGQGAYVGRDSIRRGLDRFGPAGLRRGELNDHLQLMPVVTIAADGLGATLRGVEMTMLGIHEGASSWGINICEGRYVKVRGLWRIAALRISPRLLADYDLGWEDALPPLPAASTRFPPDRPLEEVSAYPAHASPAIGFAHPVTDARPSPDAGEETDADAIRTQLAIARAHDAAENIANAYGYYIDEFRWDETADLFAVDGWKELSYIGTYIGRERIRESLVSRYGRNGRRAAFLAIHQKTQPYVTVAPDGQSARIRLKLFQFNSASDADASMIVGLYEEQAVIEDGVWKIHGMDLDYVVLAGYSGGWARVEPGASQRFAPSADDVAKFAPDGPLRGLAYAPYPEIGPIGFHFVNPVSGREPAILFSWSDGRFG